MSNVSKYDFTSWLETKNPDEEYKFSDGNGCCLMGQYMTSKGDEWSFPLYANYVNAVLGEQNTSVMSSDPRI